ncbi:hypothetical protein [Brevundimonas sp. Root1279]|uniref:hypothetical protein n=1 Tax=Brevundimonas sp. Root1279 TaxID=1736443 RepID=UPI0006F279E3|nr:hypothetical protein [Brevundimonas sp. Root1279]KQW80754.1 hypothetical protein ASC65_12315 [Brevundimonas sp. Root1279]
MSTYLCFLYGAGAVPEFRLLPCEQDSEVPHYLAHLLDEWPDSERVEVTDGARLVMRLEKDALDQLRSATA